ncbi:serine/threonine-protein kinase [Hyalangium versicolor]|uniref:serine/threonine-protein kinase n=1 Tax=Hyalangium versicolor TaxID=2861190 RepID=UPI001CCE242A|nr:serine/threonine-protein kinase [Hyalangium versicolor]
MSDKKHEEGSRADVEQGEETSPEERTTEDMSDEAPEEGLSPEARRELAVVIKGMERLSRLLQRQDSFTAGRVTFKFLRLLEERKNGVQLLLFERSLPHGMGGYVVVKRLHHPQRAELRQRLKEEVQLAFRLHHPAIAQAHHFKVFGGTPYVIMEYVAGLQLESLLSMAALRRQPLPTPFALYITAEVADALEYAHTLTDREEGGRPLGIIHRDVSPRNIRVGRRGGEVKLTDFGAAFSKRVGRQETPELLKKGELLYASPEYLLDQPMDARSDIFSLGLVLLEALTSRHLLAGEQGAALTPSRGVKVRADEAPQLPLEEMLAWVERFGPEDVERAVAGLSEGLKALLRRALQRDPAERHATAGELLGELRAELSVLAPGYGRREAAEHVERLLSEARAVREVAEPVEGGLYPESIDSHELEG